MIRLSYPQFISKRRGLGFLILSLLNAVLGACALSPGTTAALLNLTFPSLGALRAPSPFLQSLNIAEGRRTTPKAFND